MLVNECGADLKAKNIHGQTASDLVPDLTLPSWKGVFVVSDSFLFAIGVVLALFLYHFSKSFFSYAKKIYLIVGTRARRPLSIPV